MHDLPTLLTRHTGLLLGTARRLTEPDAPSLCQGWTRGHILTHLARNADGLSALVRAASEGTGEPMYASDAEREADIDAGADRPLPELIADLESSAQRLHTLLPRLEEVDPGFTVERTPGGLRFKAAALPWMRLREVVYHHVDLAAGFTFADVEPELVRDYLEDEYVRLGDLPAQQARAADLLWRARGIREDG